MRMIPPNEREGVVVVVEEGGGWPQAHLVTEDKESLHLVEAEVILNVWGRVEHGSARSHDQYEPIQHLRRETEKMGLGHRFTSTGLGTCRTPCFFKSQKSWIAFIRNPLFSQRQCSNMWVSYFPDTDHLKSWGDSKFMIYFGDYPIW